MYNSRYSTATTTSTTSDKNVVCVCVYNTILEWESPVMSRYRESSFYTL